MNSWNREDACGSAQTDYGADPIAANVIQAARENRNFRTAFWTGRRLQMTLMEIPVHGDIGVEMHPETDQVIRVEEGRALVESLDGVEAYWILPDGSIYMTDGMQAMAYSGGANSSEEHPLP